MMDQRRFYVVRAVFKQGTVTHNCPSPEWAVRKYRDAVERGLTDITITDPDGQRLTSADLERSTDEEAIPMARIHAHQS